MPAVLIRWPRVLTRGDFRVWTPLHVIDGGPPEWTRSSLLPFWMRGK